MHTIVRRCAAVVTLTFFAACGSSLPTSPTGAIQPPAALPSAAAAPVSVFPSLSGPSRTFAFEREVSYPVRDYTKGSRLVLYDNGAFVLQYPTLGAVGYRGGYTEGNGVITFEWEGWSAAGPWGATGTLQGDSLRVQYNFIMQMTDFEDAVYSLAR
jgi:hypothetical protein